MRQVEEILRETFEKAKEDLGQRGAEQMVTAVRAGVDWEIPNQLNEEVEALGRVLSHLRKVEGPVAFGLAMDRWAQESTLFQQLAPLTQNAGDKGNVLAALEKIHADLVALRDGFLRQPTKTQAALEKAAERVGVAGVWS